MGLAYWDQFGEIEEKSIFKKSLVAASDGIRLNTVEAGTKNAPPVLIVNPPGVAFLVASRLAHRLAKTNHVVSWESRGSPFLEEHESITLTATLPRLAEDAVDVCRSFGLQKPHIVTVSDGTRIVTWASQYLSLDSASVSLIGPSGVTARPYEGSWGNFLKQVMAASDDTATSKSYRNAISRLALAMSMQTDPLEKLFGRLIALNFITPERAREYGLLLRTLSTPLRLPSGEDAMDQISLFDALCTRVPAALFHCRDDDVIPYADSLEAAARNSSAKFVLYPRGRHLMPFIRPDIIAADISSFIANSLR